MMSTFKVKPHHVTPGRLEFEMHLFLIQKASEKGNESWTSAATEEKLHSSSEELSGLVVEKIFRLITSMISEARERLRLEFF